MIDARVYSRRYVSLMWVRNPIMMAEKAHCYPCCDVPTDWMCRRCLEFRCKLNRNEDKMSVIVSGGPGTGSDSIAKSLAKSAYNIIMYVNPRQTGKTFVEKLKKIASGELKICALPGCIETTRHNGGYCCPEHCREHQAQMGKKVKALGR